MVLHVLDDTSTLSVCLSVFLLQAVGVSAATGLGVDDFFAAVADAVKEYHTDYKPEIDRLRQEQVECYSRQRS